MKELILEIGNYVQQAVIIVDKRKFFPIFLNNFEICWIHVS